MNRHEGQSGGMNRSRNEESRPLGGPALAEVSACSLFDHDGVTQDERCIDNASNAPPNNSNSLLSRGIKRDAGCMLQAAQDSYTPRGWVLGNNAGVVRRNLYIVLRRGYVSGLSGLATAPVGTNHDRGRNAHSAH